LSTEERRLVRDYLKRQLARLTDAGSALSAGDFPEAVRYSQEVVEICLKAALRLEGIEYTKQHHAGDLLIAHRDRFPDRFGALSERLSQISLKLAGSRAPSL
jgi:HEPN domain-containing protein